MQDETKTGTATMIPNEADKAFSETPEGKAAVAATHDTGPVVVDQDEPVAHVSELDWKRAAGTVLGMRNGTGDARITFNAYDYLEALQVLADAYHDQSEGKGTLYRGCQIGNGRDTMGVRALYFFVLGVNVDKRKTQNQIVKTHLQG